MISLKARPCTWWFIRGLSLLIGVAVGAILGALVSPEVPVRGALIVGTFTGIIAILFLMRILGRFSITVLAFAVCGAYMAIMRTHFLKSGGIGAVVGTIFGLCTALLIEGYKKEARHQGLANVNKGESQNRTG